MTSTASQYLKLVAFMLFVSIVTQIAYVGLLADVGIVEGWPLRSTIWAIETVAFAVLAVAALATLAEYDRYRLIWAAVAISGVLNALQAGMGLSMFLPPSQAGDSGKLLFDTILAGAFVFFFLAKALIGLASVMLGFAVFKMGSRNGKIIGVLAMLAGAAAIALNIAALPQGLTLVFAAGAAGTAATLTLAIATWLVSDAKHQRIGDGQAIDSDGIG